MGEREWGKRREKGKRKKKKKGEKKGEERGEEEKGERKGIRVEKGRSYFKILRGRYKVWNCAEDFFYYWKLLKFVLGLPKFKFCGKVFCPPLTARITPKLQAQVPDELTQSQRVIKQRTKMFEADIYFYVYFFPTTVFDETSKIVLNFWNNRYLGNILCVTPTPFDD